MKNGENPEGKEKVEPQPNNEPHPEPYNEPQPEYYNEPQPEYYNEPQPEYYGGGGDPYSNPEPKKKKFWKSLPGYITQIAAVATALGTIITVIFTSIPPGAEVYMPQISSFDALESEIVLGESCPLCWEVMDATLVSIDNGVGEVALNGMVYVNPTETTTYRLTALNKEGKSVTATVTIIVLRTPLIEFNADPNPISSGISTTLYWNVTGADNISIASLDIFNLERHLLYVFVSLLWLFTKPMFSLWQTWLATYKVQTQRLKSLSAWSG